LIATGTGVIDRLTHNHVPHSTDIRVGDMLVTSGLGGKFPEGYPVAEVTSVLQDESHAFARVQSQPVAKIDRLRYVLLLWPEKAASSTAIGSKAGTVKEAETAKEGKNE
jgi:rod shape-determining protein MreC